MKLSAKWLTALAALVLLVVAVTGMSARPASAATGAVYAANEWSKLTNESAAPSGYLNASSVYATYPTATRLIESSSNKVRIVVTDADLNTTSSVADAMAASVRLNAVGAETILTLTAAGSPIAGAAADVLVFTGAGSTGGTALGAQANVEIGFIGDGSVAGWIRVTSNISNGSATQDVYVTYPTSAVNTTTATGSCTTFVAGCIRVKTDVNTAGQIVMGNETGLNTGRFVGYINLVENLEANAQASSTAGGDSLATIRVNAGPVTIEYSDGGTTRTVSVLVDTSAPTVSITGPANSLATRDRQPFFSGTVSETGAGLKLVQQTVSSVSTGPANSFVLAIDKVDDAANAAVILSSAGAVQGAGNAAESVTMGTVADGNASFSFSHQPPAFLPTAGIVLPDHKVDWQVRVSDLAGNIGFSDSDLASLIAGTPVTGGFQSHMVKIDRVEPAFTANAGGCSPTTPTGGTTCANATGKVYDTTTKVDSTSKTSSANVKVTFNDSVSGVDAGDFSVVLTPGGTHVPSSVTVSGAVVYLTLGTTIPSNATAVVSLSGTVTDSAGNSAAAGSVAAPDGLPPVVTVTLASGSGIGTGSEGAAQLTKSTIVATITTDESVSVTPTVETFILDGAQLIAPAASLAIGGNVFTYSVPATGADGSKALKVVATDPNGNIATSGSAAVKSFKLDSSLAAAVFTPAAASTTTLKKPFITVDFSADASTVTISEITLDSVDVTASLVASTGNKKYFIVPATNLTNASHTVTIPIGKVKDAAGNTNAAAVTFSFTVADRKTFDLSLFAGWNLVSLPSDPVDPDISTVLTNSSVDQVVAYDATDSANPWRIATRDAVSKKWTSTTETPLNAMRAGRGYWIHTNNFEAAKVSLVGPVEPGAGSPPAVTSIMVAKGWNLIGITDPDRSQTQNASGAGLLRGDVDGVGGTAVTLADYLSGPVETRVYKYNPTTLAFTEVAGGDQVVTGGGLWVYIVPNNDGTVPAITP